MSGFELLPQAKTAATGPPLSYWEIAIERPPNVRSLQEWGDRRAMAGRHRGLTLKEIEIRDPGYVQYLCSRNLTSPWALEIRNYLIARNRVQETGSMQTRPESTQQKVVKTQKFYMQIDAEVTQNGAVRRPKNDLVTQLASPEAGLTAEQAVRRQRDIFLKISEARSSAQGSEDVVTDPTPGWSEVEVKAEEDGIEEYSEEERMSEKARQLTLAEEAARVSSQWSEEEQIMMLKTLQRNFVPGPYDDLLPREVP